MTKEELDAILKAAGPVGQINHLDYAQYVTVIERRKRTDKGWQTDGTAYMSVDGRLAMANRDHALQGKRMAFENPVVLVDNDEQLTMMVAVDSEVYGRRHGTATSRKVDGPPIEMQHPWEIAETSAMGRALAAMGYGLLPGSGLASAEDMQRAQQHPGAADGGERRQQRPAAPLEQSGAGSKPTKAEDTALLSERQAAFLLNAYERAHGVDGAEAAAHLDDICSERYGHPLAECTVKEGRDLSFDLRERETEGPKAKKGEAAAPAGTTAKAARKITAQEATGLMGAYASAFNVSPGVARRLLNTFCQGQLGHELGDCTTDQLATLTNLVAERQDAIMPEAIEVASEPDAPAAAGPAYLADSTNWRSTIATLTANKLTADPEATAREWLDEGMTGEQVKAAIKELHEARWRKAYYAGIRELGITDVAAKELLQVDTTKGLYDNNVNNVLQTLRELTKQEPPAG
jgi:hypothetical protein